MKKITLLSILLFTTIIITAQNIKLSRIEPLSWWVGMQNNNLQLLIYGENISLSDVEIKTDKAKITKIHKTENPNYLFVDLEIYKNASPGVFEILFKKDNKIVAKQNYELLQKTERERGFSTSDFIYLLMPDRFSNGNTANDSPDVSLEKCNRTNKDGRHGGDIQGVINHLDYISNLGATAIWLTPFQENNMPNFSYHGYGITDFYHADARAGVNDDYKKLADQCHKKNLKLIMDVVLNHFGSSHWWMKDLPEKSWINGEKFAQTNYRGEAMVDNHASKYDQDKFVKGWFVEAMPDLNQRNEYVANYLIQCSIWWVEFAGLNGLRVDTQPYSYKEFTSRYMKSLHDEFPNLTIVGEAWLQSIPHTAYYKGNSMNYDSYNSNTNTVTDFPLYYSTKEAFKEDDGWTTGLSRIYSVLSQDFLYADAGNNLVFLDNHDLDRYFSAVGEDINRMKMGLTFLLTTRGIPMIYYGTELGMTGLESMGHGSIRKDFPGGWADDKLDLFKFENLSKEQKQISECISKLANWRKTNNAVKNGKFLHFVPENNTYVYFKYTEKEAVMVIFNNNEKENKTIDCERFTEILKDYKSGKEILSDKTFDKLDKIEIPKKSAMVIELIRK